MSSGNKIPAKMTSDNDQNSSRLKIGYLKPPEQGLKCPRCDSPNTKFCYYNNYSLSQPRHFCKTCRRYWTSGGALRNVPIGGGCRKYKKMRSDSRQSCNSKESPSSSTSETTSLKYFDGVSPPIDFHLGGHLFSRLDSPITSGVYNQFPTGINTTTTCFEMDPSRNSTSLMGFTYLGPSNTKQGEIGSLNGRIQEMTPLSFNTGLAPSIESLSFINQDLHWRLQQQRMAEMLSEENHQKETRVSSVPEVTLENQLQKPEPILFQNLEISKPGANSVGNTTEWFVEDSSYTPNETVDTINHEEDTTRNWTGIQAWSDIHQYGSLP